MDKLLFIFAFNCICGVMADEFLPPPSYVRTSLGDSIDVSTMKVLKATYDAAEDKNVVSSPLALMMLLSLFNLGAGPATQSEITRFLGGTDTRQTSDLYKNLMLRYSELNPDYLTVADKISVSNRYTLNMTFAADAQAYRCDFDTLDFGKPAEAAAATNRWAAEKTRGLITEPVSKDSLGDDVAAMLYNVIYFNGHWHVPFKAEETKDKDFHVSRDSVVKKPMMHLLQSLYYTESEELGAKIIELPYQERGFRMVVVLPNEVDGLPSVLEKTAEKGILSDVFRLNPAGRDVDLDMPKFDIRTKIDFNDILPKVGVSKLFAEFAPGIVNVPVKVSKAFQEAFIKVDEKGAKAGAFTGLSCLCAVMANSVSPPIDTRTLANAIDVSTMKVLKAVYDSAEDKNIVSSPLGLMTLLSLYNTGAGPGAKSEVNAFLGGADYTKTFDSYKYLIETFAAMNPDSLTVANKITVSNQYTLNDLFAASGIAYRSEIDTLDFTKPEEAAAAINRWASEKTKGHIQEPVSKETFTPDVVAALLNVIYFNGHWHVPFKAEETKEKDFHVSRDSVVKKKMMHLLQSLFYTESEELGAKMIELPYQERGFRMVVVLPNEIDGLPSVLEKAAEKGILKDVSKLAAAGSDVDLDMPKFDIRTKINFKDILPKVGVSKLFYEGAPGIVKENPVKVSKAFQEAFIKVDEVGATAGAFTAVIMNEMAMLKPPSPVKFTVDHPFLYAILYEDKILFAGTYST